MLGLAEKLTNALLTVTAAIDQSVVWMQLGPADSNLRWLARVAGAVVTQDRPGRVAQYSMETVKNPSCCLPLNNVSYAILAFSALDFPSSRIRYKMCRIAG